MNSLPSLIVCENNCLIKMIGYPFACTYRDSYPIMMSYCGDTLKILLEMIFFKIESKTNILFKLEEDDMSQFKFNEFLFASINEKDNNCTEYSINNLSTKDLKKNNYVEKKWSPTEITHYENIVITKLIENSNNNGICIMSIDDELLNDHDLANELKNMISNSYISIHDGLIELISIQSLVVCWDGKYWIGENGSSEMINWINSLRK